MARIKFIDEEADEVLYAYGGSSGHDGNPSQMLITEIAEPT